MRKKKHYMVNISGDGDGNGSSKKTTNRHENAIKLFEDIRRRVEDWDGPITAGPAKMDGWLRPREEVLTGILSDLFGWTDRTYLHAVMHVQNAVLDLQARAAGAQKRLDHLTARMQDLAGYECEYGDGCPDFSGTRCLPCKVRETLDAVSYDPKI